MRILTHDWWHGLGKYDDHEEYQKNRLLAEGEFNAIKEKLPTGLRDFMQFYRSLLTSFDLDVDKRILKFKLIGERVSGTEYEPVTYEVTLSEVRGFTITPSGQFDANLRHFGMWGALGDYGFSEFTILDDGAIRWDMLFWKRIEFSVVFQDADISISPRSSYEQGKPTISKQVELCWDRRQRRHRRRSGYHF